jgi:hypothetical protein
MDHFISATNSPSIAANITGRSVLRCMITLQIFEMFITGDIPGAPFIFELPA